MTFQEWLQTDEGRMVSFYPMNEALERTWAAAQIAAKDVQGEIDYHTLLTNILDTDPKGILALARAITAARNAISFPYQALRLIADQCDVRDVSGKHCANRPVLPRIFRDGYKILLCESCWQRVLSGAYNPAELGLDKQGK